MGWFPESIHHHLWLSVVGWGCDSSFSGKPRMAKAQRGYVDVHLAAWSSNRHEQSWTSEIPVHSTSMGIFNMTEPTKTVIYWGWLGEKKPVETCWNRGLPSNIEVSCKSPQIVEKVWMAKQKTHTHIIYKSHLNLNQIIRWIWYIHINPHQSHLISGPSGPETPNRISLRSFMMGFLMPSGPPTTMITEWMSWRHIRHRKFWTNQLTRGKWISSI